MNRPATYRCCTVWLIIFTMVYCTESGFTKGRSDITPDSILQRGAFIFRAQWAIAYTGERRQLTPPYELLVTSDSIDCYLPYLGRMYTVPAPDELRFMSIDFTSKKFSYMKYTNRRSGWDIIISPADARNVQELYFSISRNGRATLGIHSASRDQMFYEGTIEPISH